MVYHRATWEAHSFLDSSTQTGLQLWMHWSTLTLWWSFWLKGLTSQRNPEEAIMLFRELQETQNECWSSVCLWEPSCAEGISLNKSPIVLKNLHGNFCCNYSTCHSANAATDHLLNQWACLYCNNSLLTKTNGRSDLTCRPEHAHSSLEDGMLVVNGM